jgi:hypothetical protein
MAKNRRGREELEAAAARAKGALIESRKGSARATPVHFKSVRRESGRRVEANRPLELEAFFVFINP